MVNYGVSWVESQVAVGQTSRILQLSIRYIYDLCEMRGSETGANRIPITAFVSEGDFSLIIVGFYHPQT